jgi:acetyltransferase EpsM
MQIKSIPVTIPLLNPNEPEVRLASLMIVEGQNVIQGQVVATLETTKSTTDLTAEIGGFVINLNYAEGETILSGETLCYLASSLDWKPPESLSHKVTKSSKPGSMLAQNSDLPNGLRITQPALALVNQYGLDLSNFPLGPLVTENFVKSLLEKDQFLDSSGLDKISLNATDIIIYGGGGHGKSIIDLLRILKTYQIIGVVDDGMSKNAEVLGVPVLGGHEVLPELRSRGVHLAVNAVGGIGDLQSRIKVFSLLAEAGFTSPIIVHPTAFIEPSANISSGVQVLPHAYIGSHAKIGFGAIINTGAIVSHDCQLGDHVNLSPGAILAGEVQVGSGTLIGMGVTVNLGVTIGAHTRIGNSATIKSDVPTRGIVQAGSIWPE